MEKEIVNNIAKRNYGIDLLKLLSCLFIIICHVSGEIGYHTISSLDTIHPTNSITVLILVFFRYFGAIGNAVFLCCSIWFFVDNKKVSINKIVNIIIDMWIISIIVLVIRKLNGHEYILIELVSNVLPFYFEKWWYISCYILLYIIHPYLNIIIKEIKEKEHRNICVVFIVIYCVLCMFSEHLYGSYLTYFIMYYFFISYVKKYLYDKCENIKISIVTLILAVCSLVLTIVITNYIGNKFSINIELEKWNCINNVFVFLISMSLLNIFRQIRLNKTDFVCKFSGLSLYIYIIHYNELIEQDFILKQVIVYTNTYGSKNILIFAILLSLFVYIVTTIIGYVYSISIGKLIKKILYKFREKIGYYQ